MLYPEKRRPWRKPSAEKASHTTEEKASYGTSEEHAHVARNTTPNPDLWIFDSGASSHMTKHREYILNYESFTTPKNVSIANEQGILAYGSGDIKMRMLKGGGDKVIVWCKILYVSDLGENLWSLLAACLDGMAVEEQGNDIVVRDKHNQVVLSATQVGTDIIVNCKVLIDDEHALKAASKVDAMLLHKCLGHMEIDCIIQTSKIVDDITLPSNTDYGVCEPCIQAKQHHAPISRAPVERAEELFMRLFVDV